MICLSRVLLERKKKKERNKVLKVGFEKQYQRIFVEEVLVVEEVTSFKHQSASVHLFTLSLIMVITSTTENNTAMATDSSNQTLVPGGFGSNSMPRRRTRDIVDAMEVQQPVGVGTYGVVFKAIDKTLLDRPLVALKKIKMDKETQGFPVTALREIKILNLMNHENIVKLREIITFDKENSSEQESLKTKGIDLGDVFMVFEFVDYDLGGLLKSPNFQISDDIIRSYMFQLLSGVQYLHENKILHRDIKSANILITKGHVLKIADWGLARALPQTHKLLTVPVVTLWYRSPELACGHRQYGPEIDIWSVG